MDINSKHALLIAMLSVGGVAELIHIKEWRGSQGRG